MFLRRKEIGQKITFQVEQKKNTKKKLDFIYFCSRTKMTEGFSTSPTEKFFFFQFGAFRVQAESFLRYN